MDERMRMLASLGPVLEHLAGVDCSDPGATAALNAALPLAGPAMSALRDDVLAGLAAGWLAPRGEPGMTWGRLAKATPETCGFSIDAVGMAGPGPEHTHPQGEIDLCFTVSGNPSFDGHPPGWLVLPPGSRHVPTVAGGEMAILYFLPDGAIAFHKT